MWANPPMLKSNLGKRFQPPKLQIFSFYSKETRNKKNESFFVFSYTPWSLAFFFIILKFLKKKSQIESLGYNKLWFFWVERRYLEFWKLKMSTYITFNGRVDLFTFWNLKCVIALDNILMAKRFVNLYFESIFVHFFTFNFRVNCIY